VYVHDPTLLKKYGTALKLNREPVAVCPQAHWGEEHYIYLKITQYKRTHKNSLAR